MSSSNDSEIRQAEAGLFASMAKVRQPMAPDSAPTSSPNTAHLPGDHADAQWARMKKEFPLLTDKQLDELMM